MKVSPSGRGTLVPLNAPVWVAVGTAVDLNATYWNPLNEFCGANFPAVPTNLSAYPYQTAARTVLKEFVFIQRCNDIAEAQLQFLAWFGWGAGSATSPASGISLVPEAPITELADFAVGNTCAGSYTAFQWDYMYSNGTGTPPYFYNSTTCFWFGSPTGAPANAGPVTFTESGLPTNTTWGIALNSPSDDESTTGATPTLTIGWVYALVNYSIVVDTIPDPSNGEWWIGTVSGGQYLIPPVHYSVHVHFRLVSDLTGFSFPATVSASGLPEGAGYTLQVSTPTGESDRYIPPGWTNPPQTGLWLSGNSTLSVNGSVVYTANGTGYYVSGVNRSVASINSTSGTVKPDTKVRMLGVAWLVLEYVPMYRLTVEATTGGFATPSSQWVPSGQPVTLRAIPNPGELFTGWTGYGAGGSITTHSPSALRITVGMDSPITEIANFRPEPPTEYALTVSSTGLPAGLTYSILLNGVAYSGVGSFTVTNLTQGAYTIGSMVVYSTPVPSARWIPELPVYTSYGANGTGAVWIGSDGSATIRYTVQYELSVSITGGGTVTRNQSGPWYDWLDHVALTAQPDPGPPGVGSYFVSWEGTGAASQSGTDPVIVVTMTGPVSELAQFVLKPVPAPRTFVITVEETGLPPGMEWNATVGSIGNSTTNSSMEISGLNATYNLSVPAVAGPPGVRYVASPGSVEADALDQNLTVQAAFAEQCLITVAVSGNGTATPLGSGWWTSGARLSLSASATDPRWAFVSWRGNISANAAVLNITVSGPMNELAQFTPVYTTHVLGNPLAGMPTSFALLAGLAGTGVAVAYVACRVANRPGRSVRRRRQRGPGTTP
jgi:hypothetical protein